MTASFTNYALFTGGKFLLQSRLFRLYCGFYEVFVYGWTRAWVAGQWWGRISKSECRTGYQEVVKTIWQVTREAVGVGLGDVLSGRYRRHQGNQMCAKKIWEVTGK